MDHVANEDRVLLELAAKAAELIQDTPGWQHESLTVLAGDGGWRRWNPLADDGDALRLAVKLDLDVMPSGAWVGASNNELAALVQNGYGIDEVEEHAGDPYAATRRAIVRAAAEIGKAKAA